ncbi:Fur family transcriptional regulator [Desulfohalovibrio reitneri]|uniref:Fur family transcriptional regulator n=1 Tax=Desulfohalovibrio reitneri TaxID=1307759 RepID=UPI0006895EB9|nr:transcriptional repressor [Desulfohalovibrio reitneri]
MTESRLRLAGLEPTANRSLVLDLLHRAEGPLSAPELLARVEGRMNKVTLYRILDLLTRHGLVLKHQGSEAAHFCAGVLTQPVDQGPRRHGHFHCRRCGRCFCLGPESLPPAPEPPPPAASVDEVGLTLSGVCRDCEKTSA